MDFSWEKSRMRLKGTNARLELCWNPRGSAGRVARAAPSCAGNSSLSKALCFSESQFILLQLLLLGFKQRNSDGPPFVSHATVSHHSSGYTKIRKAASTSLAFVEPLCIYCSTEAKLISPASLCIYCIIEIATMCTVDGKVSM